MERSYLFVPGNRPERIEKAIDSNADAVIIDLEDAVASEEKAEARQKVAEVVKKLGTIPKKLYVRVNGVQSDFWEEDVALVSHFPFAGIMLPKTESQEVVRRLENKLSAQQTIIPLIETAKGMIAVCEIASATKSIERLAFGAIDYCLDLGISITASGEELLYPRSALVVASRAAGIAAPIDTVFVDIKNEKGLCADTKRAKRLGMFAKLCIHPFQVKTVNSIFAPSRQELKWAQEVITAFEKAKNQGLAVINLNEKMIDYPVYKQALQIVQRSENDDTC